MPIEISQYNFDMARSGINANDLMSINYPFYAVTPHRSNLALQMLLQTNCYISFLWSFSYLINIIICVNDLINPNGAVTLVAYFVAVVTEVLRLYSGYSVNLRTGAPSQWLVLTLTPCILLPAMVYLRLVTVGQVFYLSLLSNVIFFMIAMEILVAILHFICCKPIESTKWDAKDQLERNNSTDFNVNGEPLSASQEPSPKIRRRTAGRLYKS